MGLTQISTAGVKDDAVTASKLPANSVGASELADDAVDTAAIAADAVTGAKIADDAIDSEHITDGSIDTAHIGTGQVTGAKLAAGAVSEAAKIADSIITGAKIGSGTIEAGNLATNAVTTAKITDGNVTLAKMASESVDEDNLQISNAGSNGQFLSKQSGNTGGLTWADVSSPGKNALINGGMQIAQYPANNTAINTYGPLDRWRTMGGPMGFTISQVTDATNYPNTHYALKAHRTAGNTQEYDLGAVQGIETINSRYFAGKQCTFSVRARVGANFSGPSSVLKVAIFTGTGTDENPVNMTSQASTVIDKTVSTTATKYSITHTIPAATTQISCAVYYQCRGTAGAEDWFEITDCQFEVGSSASDFEYRDYQSELARCQRYYQSRIVEANTNYYPHQAGSASFYIKTEALPVTMRAIPTHTVTASTTLGTVGGTRHSVNSSGVYWNSAGQDGYMYYLRSGGGEIFNLSAEL
mgnify:CR=1 FL=1